MPPLMPPELNDYLIDWPLPTQNEYKSFFETTHRVCPPEKTLERLSPLKELAGITRLSDITYLDCVGIPTYLAVRPIVDHYQENISVYNGKGLTKIQAKVSALMEAFERFSGERNGRPALLASLKEVKKLGKAVDPNDLALPLGETYEPHELLDWVCGLELISEEIRFVPACAVFCPYVPTTGGKFFRRFSNTNGLASGNTLGEAVSQALAEVIERDAEILAELSGKATAMNLDTFQSPLIQELIQKFHRAGIKLVVKEITSEIGIPTFFAAADEPATENPVLLCRGVGTHVNAEIAVMRAITEVAQSRCTFISGSREDLIDEEYKKNMNYHSLKKKMNFWFYETPPLKDFRTVETPTHQNVTEDIEVMLKALRKSGFKEVIVTDLTLPRVDVPVVRVIVPGLEQSLEARRIGKRALAYFP